MKISANVLPVLLVWELVSITDMLMSGVRFFFSFSFLIKKCISNQTIMRQRSNKVVQMQVETSSNIGIRKSYDLLLVPDGLKPFLSALHI